MNLKYLIGALISLPLLPIMYVQGLGIRKRVPQLPEAKGPSGSCQAAGVSGRKFRLLTIGESTIAGVGVATHEEGFSGTLAREIHRSLGGQLDWRVYAKSGYTAREVIDKLLPAIEESEADWIVVGLGGNDAFTLNRPWNWRADMHKLIAQLQSRFPRTSIYFCNMPPIKEFPAFSPLIKFVIGNLVEILGQELHKLVQDYEQVYYAHEVITLEKWVHKLPIGTQPSDFFSDGVHPSKLTYQTWAKEMAGKICREQAPENSTLPTNP